MLVLNQGQEFLCYVCVGMIICFIYDFFRSSRYVFNTSDIVTHIEDTVFVIIISVLIIASILCISSGTLRFYIVLGIFLGIIIYALTISKLCVIMFKSIFMAIKFVVNIIWRNTYEKHFKI